MSTMTKMYTPLWDKSGTLLVATRGKKIYAKQALKQGGLDFEVEKVKGYARTRNPETGKKEMQRVQGQYYTSRTDTGAIFGAVKERYTVVQNGEALDFLDALIDSGELVHEVVGSTKHGAKTFIQSALPSDILIGGIPSERIHCKVTTLNSHDGQGSIRFIVSPERMLCMNALPYVLKNAVTEYKIRHTSSLEGRIAEARNVLGLTYSYYAEFERLGDEMVNTPMSDRQFENFLNKLVPLPDLASAKTDLGLKVAEKVQDSLRSIFYHAENLSEIRGTAWAAAQAASEHAQHGVEGRVFASSGSEDPDRVRADNRIDRILLNRQNIGQRAIMLLAPKSVVA